MFSHRILLPSSVQVFNFEVLFLTCSYVVSESQHHKTPVFYPSPASTTTSHIPLRYEISKTFVFYHRDEIPPEDLASFSCVNVGASGYVQMHVRVEAYESWGVPGEP